LGVFIAFLILLIYYAITSKKKYLLYILTFYIILGTTLIIGIIPYIYKLQKYSFSTHILLLSSSIGIFKKYPIFGTGLGTFSYYFGLYVKPFIHFYYNNIDTPPLFTLLLSEIGIIGFIAYFTFIIVIFKQFINKIRSVTKTLDNIDHLVLAGFIAGFLALLIANLFHSYFDLFFNWIIIGVFLGMANKIDSKNALLTNK
jgi:O-antigen ligase